MIRSAHSRSDSIRNDLRFHFYLLLLFFSGEIASNSYQYLMFFPRRFKVLQLEIQCSGREPCLQCLETFGYSCCFQSKPERNSRSAAFPGERSESFRTRHVKWLHIFSRLRQPSRSISLKINITSPVGRPLFFWRGIGKKINFLELFYRKAII